MVNNKSVYVMLNKDNGLVKIGVSENVEQRRYNLSMEFESDISIIFVGNLISNPFEIERKCHLELGKYRVFSEWFNCDTKKAEKVVDFMTYMYGSPARKYHCFIEAILNRDKSHVPIMSFTQFSDITKATIKSHADMDAARFVIMYGYSSEEAEEIVHGKITDTALIDVVNVIDQFRSISRIYGKGSK